jgi:sulfate permease, SulP family
MSQSKSAFYFAAGSGGKFSYPGMLSAVKNSFSLKGGNLKDEVLSGLTVALALVPEAVAFSIIAGVEPLVGLYAAFMVGLVTSVFGGRPGMISGATGALAVVMVSLVATHGVQYLFATVVLMGLIQMLAGFLKLGKFVRLIPLPVIFGFVNGLAIVIFMAQMAQFKTTTAEGTLTWMQGTPMYLMLGLVGLTMGIIYFLPKLTKAVPASLAAIVVVSALAIGFGLQTRTVGDIASVAGGLPSFNIPSVPFNMETLGIIFPYALILAAIGLIESLLTLTLVDEITGTRGRSNKECAAQGLANVLTGFFGGMGGCAMIGQSLINANSGGRSRISGIVAAVFLLIFIVFLSSLIEMIPMAALTGVMIMVAIGTFEWVSFKILRKIPVVDAIVMILVTVLTLIFDLAIAVIAGVIVSALAFAWENAVRIRVRKRMDTLTNTKYYEVFGPLFFGSVSGFNEKFDPATDPENVVIDFIDSRVADHSGIEAVGKIAEKYKHAGKNLTLIHLSEDCLRLLDRAGDMVNVNIIRDSQDPRYKVISDVLED